MVREGLIRALGLAVLAGTVGCRPAEAPANDMPPPAPREFRAAWVSTVANIDWPSKKGLSTEEQKAEIARIVERAEQLHLNALILQVRPSADAIYPSLFEPWTEYLTGEQGKAPDPPYDPLALWVEEAHRHGLELHAWFNPYRARHKEAKSPPSPIHISRTNPNVVKSYDGYLWMDPGESFASARTLMVILDVVGRYDIDGVHIDDYFYPYPIPEPSPPPLPPCAGIDEPPRAPVDQDFPDEPSWKEYLETGGTLSRADWRRKNVSDLIVKIYILVHHAKPWIKSGISPFGVGRPGRRPPGITGFSQYDKLYADVEQWLERGVLDYLSPQLYWRMEQKGQAFGPLLDYWQGARENPHRRHVWPGLFTSRIDDTEKSWPTDEVVGQIALDRARPLPHGQVHFSMVSLLQNRRGIGDRLLAGPYQTPALVPASPWLDPKPPEPPSVTFDRRSGRVHATILPAPSKPVGRFALWTRTRGAWRFTVVPAARPELDLDPAIDAGVVSSIDRAGNESSRVFFTPPSLR